MRKGRSLLVRWAWDIVAGEHYFAGRIKIGDGDGRLEVGDGRGVGFFFSGSSSSRFFCLNSGNCSGATLAQPLSVPIWAWSSETRNEYFASDVPSVQVSRET